MGATAIRILCFKKTLCEYSFETTFNPIGKSKAVALYLVDR